MEALQRSSTWLSNYREAGTDASEWTAETTLDAHIEPERDPFWLLCPLETPPSSSKLAPVDVDLRFANRTLLETSSSSTTATPAKHPARTEVQGPVKGATMASSSETASVDDDEQNAHRGAFAPAAGATSTALLKRPTYATATGNAQLQFTDNPSDAVPAAGQVESHASTPTPVATVAVASSPATEATECTSTSAATLTSAPDRVAMRSKPPNSVPPSVDTMHPHIDRSSHAASIIQSSPVDALLRTSRSCATLPLQKRLRPASLQHALLARGGKRAYLPRSVSECTNYFAVGGATLEDPSLVSLSFRDLDSDAIGLARYPSLTGTHLKLSARDHAQHLVRSVGDMDGAAGRGSGTQQTPRMTISSDSGTRPDSSIAVSIESSTLEDALVSRMLTVRDPLRWNRLCTIRYNAFEWVLLEWPRGPVAFIDALLLDTERGVHQWCKVRAPPQWRQRQFAQSGAPDRSMLAVAVANTPAATPEPVTGVQHRTSAAAAAAAAAASDEQQPICCTNRAVRMAIATIASGCCAPRIDILQLCWRCTDSSDQSQHDGQTSGRTPSRGASSEQSPHHGTTGVPLIGDLQILAEIALPTLSKVRSLAWTSNDQSLLVSVANGCSYLLREQRLGSLVPERLLVAMPSDATLWRIERRYDSVVVEQGARSICASSQGYQQAQKAPGASNGPGGSVAALASSTVWRYSSGWPNTLTLGVFSSSENPAAGISNDLVPSLYWFYGSGIASVALDAIPSPSTKVPRFEPLPRYRSSSGTAFRAEPQLAACRVTHVHEIEGQAATPPPLFLSCTASRLLLWAPRAQVLLPEHTEAGAPATLPPRNGSGALQRATWNDSSDPASTDDALICIHEWFMVPMRPLWRRERTLRRLASHRTAAMFWLDGLAWPLRGDFGDKRYLLVFAAVTGSRSGRSALLWALLVSTAAETANVARGSVESALHRHTGHRALRRTVWQLERAAEVPLWVPLPPRWRPTTAPSTSTVQLIPTGMRLLPSTSESTTTNNRDSILALPLTRFQLVQSWCWLAGDMPTVQTMPLMRFAYTLTPLLVLLLPLRPVQPSAADRRYVERLLRQVRSARQQTASSPGTAPVLFASAPTATGDRALLASSPEQLAEVVALARRARRFEVHPAAAAEVGVVEGALPVHVLQQQRRIYSRPAMDAPPDFPHTEAFVDWLRDLPQRLVTGDGDAHERASMSSGRGRGGA